MSAAKNRLVHMLGMPGQKITYEQARDLLDHPDVEVRRGLAERDDLEPEILFYLANDPDVLIADEPTGELDGGTEAAVLRLIRDQAAGGTAVVIASHSPAVTGLADQVLQIKDGQLQP